jgi:CRP-like cAMP-binding protein
LEVVGPGAILGLSETISNEHYLVTTEAADYTTVAFIPREEFVDFLRERADFCMQVVRLLSDDLHGLYPNFAASAPILDTPAAVRRTSN